MNKFAVLGLLVAVPLFAVTPAFATKGIDAARACVAQGPHNCSAVFDDNGGVTIVKGDTIIQCTGPQEDCHVVRTRPKQDDFNANPQSISTMGGASHNDGDDSSGPDRSKEHGNFTSLTTLNAPSTGSGGVIQ